MARTEEITRTRIRCAVYTRKSSEEGLDQDYNSIDAQKDAGHAYISSQRHEGWIPVAADYDDPAFSGGNMERPGLKQLMLDIQAKLVDVVVVYKIDRLTRSLADFSKMVEIFDAHGVSFVSVTQQFNTTTSMGRLMLNVLLSFAQFEREVTGERIRDKISASKKKGMWMGGVPPLGFDVADRKLIVNEPEAALVRRIFSDYHRINSVTMLIQHYRMEGICKKHWTTQDGKQRVGKLIDKGYVYKLLNNPLYYGMIHFKGEKFRGEHTPIITQEMWEKTQAKLSSSSRGSKKEQRHSKHTALLKGLIFSGGMIGLSEITYANAPDWFARLRLCENIYDVYLTKKFDEDTNDYINVPISASAIFNHIGLNTNHSQYSQTEWLNNIKKYQKEVDLTVREMSKNLSHYKADFVRELSHEIR